MTWFTDIRLDFIDWRLLNAGAVSGRHVAEKFGVSISQGVADINAFSAKYPDLITYSPKSRGWIPSASPYISMRGAKRGKQVASLSWEFSVPKEGPASRS